ncbi:MAG TPA: acyltransferase [Polyangiales bacterium]|jgi:acetyltransferase-like isoleucine patch superfamily enzyme
MALTPDRKVPHDWFDGRVPDVVDVADEAYLESAFSFSDCRARAAHAIQIARGAHVYSASIFDIGPHGTVTVGRCSMLNGVRIVCEQRIVIGSYATISWNVIFMDCYRMPFDPIARRLCIEIASQHAGWQVDCDAPSAPIVLHDNVWIGFDVCVLPGVTIGEGSIVGARSVVNSDVPAYTVVAGNPARPIRELARPDDRDPLESLP